METPQSTHSSISGSSSPSSYFSELATTSSRSNEDLVACNHIIAVRVPSESPEALEAYLRSLPLGQDGSKSYLLLGLGHEGAAASSAKPLEQVVSSMGDILGDSIMFKSASYGISLDKIIVPSTKVIPVFA